MKPKKERSPWLWLLLIPAQLVILVLSFLGGVGIDTSIFSGGGQGHGVPIFSILLPLLALIVTAVVVVVALTGLIIGLVRRARRRRAEAEASDAPRDPPPAP